MKQRLKIVVDASVIYENVKVIKTLGEPFFVKKGSPKPTPKKL